MARLFEGLTVLDLTQGMAGAITTMVLADGGAEVIKIEPPQGDATRREAAFVMWSRGKKSVVLDLKTPTGPDSLRSLAGTADVFVTAWSPGVAERLGVGLSQLREANPGLVTCSITGFGPVEQLTHLKGYEGIVAAKTGRHHAFDAQIPKDGPIYPALNCGSYGAAMYALQGILAALHMRRKTGRGQHVETSLLQSLNAYDWWWLRRQVMRREGGFEMPMAGAPTPQYFVGPAKDGRWLQTANAMSHLVINFVIGIGASELLDDPRFAGIPNVPEGPDREELYRIWYEKLAGKTLDEWMQVFSHEVDAGAEPFMTTQEGMSHPQVLHNGDVIEVDDPMVGASRQLGPLVKLSRTPMGPQGPAPKLGQHTREALAAAGRRRPAAFSEGTSMPRYPLEGITILEVASWFAAPFGPAILADMGAGVIRVEPYEGDPWREWGPIATKTLQGKDSICVDLKKPEGQEVLHRLVKQADVFMHNFRPSAAERLGIGYDRLEKINGRLVYLYAGAYGSSGPSSHRPAFHPIPGAICGGAVYQAGRGTPPPPGTPLTPERVRAISTALSRSNEGNPDVTAAVTVATAMLLGLHAREETGEGQYMETSMICSSLYANSDDALQFEGKRDRLVPDPELNGLHALYRFYSAKDGWVFLACPGQRDWEALCRELGSPELAEDPRFATPELRLGEDAALTLILQDALSQRTAREWEQTLSSKGLGCVEARADGYDAFASDDPIMKEAGLWVETEHPSLGKYWRYGPGVTFSEAEARLGTMSDAGEQTRSVLQELGYDDAAIEGLHASKVVNWPGA